MEAGSGDAGAGRYDMPPGFRFHPTDEEIIIHYLLNKVMDTSFAPFAIGEVDLNSSEPWDLPRKAKMGENELFFFCEKDRKYQRGMRTNRATESGYWKATGKDREILSSKKKTWLVGMKKTLVFYTGRAPKGERTNWVMHEYRLHGNFPNHNISTTAKEKWVVCKVFHKKIGSKTSISVARPVLDSLVDSPTLPSFIDYSFSTENPTTSSFVTEEDDEVKPDISSSNYHTQNNSIAPPPLIISSYDQYCSPHYLNPNPIFNPQCFHPDSFIPYQPPPLVYHQNIYPDSRTLEPCNMYIGGGSKTDHETMSSKMEDYSLNDSVVSLSHDTGVVSHGMGTEISCVQYCKEDGESKKASDHQEFEGVTFSPNIFDLDYLWS